MQMDRIKWDKSMTARCMERANRVYKGIKSVAEAAKPEAAAIKPIAAVTAEAPKVKYWDDFRIAIDKTCK